MTPKALLKSAGWFVLLAFIVAIALFSYKRYGAWQEAKLVQWKADSTNAAEATRLAAENAELKLRARDTAIVRYTVYRDRVVGSGTATPGERAAFGKCDEVVRTCAELQAADSVEKESLRKELAIARARPTERAKRLELFGEGMYDLLSAAPVLRAGVELRILGPISAAAVGDLTLPSARDPRVVPRALLGIRYKF